MMMILNLLCEYLAMVYAYKHDVTWWTANNGVLYIRCYNKADVNDIYRQIELYCHDLSVSMELITGNNGEILITLSTGEKIELSYPF